MRIDNVAVTPILMIGEPDCDALLAEYSHSTFHSQWPNEECPSVRDECTFCRNEIARWGRITAGHAPDCPGLEVGD